MGKNISEIKGAIGFFIIAVVLIGVAMGCTDGKSTKEESVQTTDVQIANPAATFCINQNKDNKYEIRKNQDGSETGYCIFPNGKECIDWLYFRGECGP